MRRSAVLPTPSARQATLRVQPIHSVRIPIWVWVGAAGLAVAALLPIAQTSDATTTGATLQELERERAAAQAEVRLLASQVGELASLSRIEQAASERLHLTVARPTTVLHASTPPPERLLPVRFMPERETGPEESRAWWQRVLDVLVFD